MNKGIHLDLLLLPSLPRELLALTASKVKDKAALRLTCHATRLAVDRACTQLVSQLPWGGEQGQAAGPLAAVLPALCPNIKLLDCSRMGKSLFSLVGCPSTVQTLICPGAGALAACMGLQTFDCNGTSVAGLGPLTTCTGLQTLSCIGTQVADLVPLAACKGLWTLSCIGTQVADLGPLAACTELQFLSCDDTEVADLGPLAACMGLQTLHCGHTQVSDLSPLTACTGLRWLSCDPVSVAQIRRLQAACSMLSVRWAKYY